MNCRTIFIYFITIFSLYLFPGAAICQIPGVLHPDTFMSAAYSPYRSYEIVAEISGKIVHWNIDEGEVLNPGIPMLEMDNRLKKAEIAELKRKLELLKKEEQALIRAARLKKKKFQRFKGLLKQKHVQPQAVEDVEIDLISFRMKLIANGKQQADTRKAIATIQDMLQKTSPRFDIPLYLSKRYREQYEYAVAGQPLARMLDISRARLHIVLPPEQFKEIRQHLKRGDKTAIRIISSSGKQYHIMAEVERLKLDRDNDYLYSYGLDLIFQPIPDLLWGEVVKVMIP